MSLKPSLDRSSDIEAVNLLIGHEDDMELSNMTSTSSEDKSDVTRVETRYTDDTEHTGPSTSGAGAVGTEDEHARINEGGRAEYRVYKIRWFGLVQLVLLNIVVSWDVSAINL